MYPDEPFDVILDGSQPVSLSNYTSLISYDLEAAVARQSMFYYQVSVTWEGKGGEGRLGAKGQNCIVET